MFTQSLEFDELNGYLKSGKVLENKLQKLSTLKNALDQLQSRANISEHPAEGEDEEEEIINIVDEGGIGVFSNISNKV